MNDTFIFIFLAGVFVLVLLVMGIIMLFKRYKAKIKEKLIAIKKKTLFNGVIRSIMLSFMKTTLSAGVQFNMWIRESEH